MMVEVVVAKLGIDGTTNAYVVILQEKEGNRLLPIWIAQPEAESIVLQMKHVRRERPMTHDLAKNIVVGLGATLRRVHITKVEKNTYFAELHLHRDEHLVQVDARPSDSIAIALRFGAPIFAESSLLIEPEADGDDDDATDITPESPGGESGATGPMSAEELKEYLEKLRPEDFGKFSL
jgi:bifunctional DNase/RNase